ncbi:MAG: PAS domain S-box protein, partial [Cyanobacteria bacterium J06635_13]
MSCLECHGKTQDAPQSMINTYGTENGFGWKLHEIVAAQTIYVPANEVFAKAHQYWLLAIAIFIVIFVLVMGAIDLLLRRAVIKPLKQLTKITQNWRSHNIAAESASIDSQKIAEIARRYDEPGQLARAFQHLNLEIVARESRLKQAQAEVKHSEVYFRSLIEQASDVIFILDRQQVITYVSPSAIAILGYEPQMMRGHHLLDFILPELHFSAADFVSLAINSQGITTPVELSFHHQNGSWLATEAIANNLLNDSIVNGVVLNLRDISEREQIDERLRLLESVIVNANDAVVITEAESLTAPEHPKIVYVNEAFSDITGYTPAEVIGKTPRILQGEKTDRHILHQIKQSLSRWMPIKTEIINYGKDGREYWVELNIIPIADRKGNYTHFVAVERNITDRKQAQAELARSENMLRTIIDSEPECVKTLGRDGTLLEINPAGLETIEADTPEDAIGKSVFPLIDSHYRQAFVELTESIFEGKSGRLEFKLTGLKGTTRWLETNAVPLKKDSEITALLAVSRDITQRKQTELQLQQERDFSHAVIDTVGALVTVLDRQGAIVSFNHTCERVTGYSLTEVQGKKVWDFLIPPQEKTATEAVFQKLLSGQFHNQYENCWLAKDGSQNLISWSNTALCNEEGQVEFIIATGIDVTEQRRVWNKLEFQYRQTKLLTEITDKIRMSIELEEILQTTVTEVQQILACDRVLIVEIQSNNTALPISEAILADLPPMLGYELADPLLIGAYLARYHQGGVLALNDLATAAIDSDIKQLLNQFQIQAKLVVPILNQHELKGLLIAHQCYSPRQWQEPEIQLLNQLAERLGVALSQAKLLDYAEKLASKRTRELTVTNQLLESEIAEREQTERDLRENQQKLAGILDNADEAIITINERQQIELFNRGAERIFGYRAAEAMGQPLDILLPQAFRLIHRRHVDTFGKSPEQSRRMAERNSSVFGRRKDGHEFSAEASVAKLQTKSGMLYTVMLKDISQRQQTLEKLRASKALLAKAEKIAKLGSWLISFNMTVYSIPDLVCSFATDASA